MSWMMQLSTSSRGAVLLMSLPTWRTSWKMQLSTSSQSEMVPWSMWSLMSKTIWIILQSMFLPSGWPCRRYSGQLLRTFSIILMSCSYQAG
ncbi:uncharacterized protein BJ212DRAFT_1592237, partial [Suillus subaureus]